MTLRRWNDSQHRSRSALIAARSLRAIGESAQSRRRDDGVSSPPLSRLRWSLQWRAEPDNVPPSAVGASDRFRSLSHARRNARRLRLSLDRRALSRTTDPSHSSNGTRLPWRSRATADCGMSRNPVGVEEHLSSSCYRRRRKRRSQDLSRSAPRALRRVLWHAGWVAQLP